MEIARNNQPDSSSVRFRLSDIISETYMKIRVRPTYSIVLWIIGFPVHLFVFFYHLLKMNRSSFHTIREQIKQEMIDTKFHEDLVERYTLQLERKQEFFGQSATVAEISATAKKWADVARIEKQEELIKMRLQEQGLEQPSYDQTFQKLVHNPLFLALSFIPGILMYSLILLYSNPYTKYIMERLFMTVFVIIGVVIIVFTLLYISPFDPAANILGEGATEEQIANFNHLYGLDQGYFSQLWNNIKGIAMFDLGSSYTGNEDVASSIARKFPITLTLTLISLFFSVLIAIPVGIISATKPNSFFDYTFMFIALLGLSIPNFWQGLIFILNFSIKLGWLPATYSPENAASIIMPVIVLGTGLTAAVARMTRSSTLEVIHEDYIITAKAKGLSRRVVLWRHAVGNAIIPIITVIGLQFGGMLGGAAVTEKVFNISGIGSYIVDKQFIPDIPGILGGVVYTAITISIVNVLIDILYAFFDPRIRSKMKQY